MENIPNAPVPGSITRRVGMLAKAQKTGTAILNKGESELTLSS
jgi:hypothetical protein